jgi:hypothetical protein
MVGHAFDKHYYRYILVFLYGTNTIDNMRHHRAMHGGSLRNARVHGVVNMSSYFDPNWPNVTITITIAWFHFGGDVCDVIWFVFDIYVVVDFTLKLIVKSIFT